MGAVQLRKYIDSGERDRVKEFKVKTVQCFADLSDFPNVSKLNVFLLLASLQGREQSEGRTLVFSLGEKKVENSTGSAESPFSVEPNEKQNKSNIEGEQGQTVLSASGHR